MDHDMAVQNDEPTLVNTAFRYSMNASMCLYFTHPQLTGNQCAETYSLTRIIPKYISNVTYTPLYSFQKDQKQGEHLYKTFE